MPHCGRFPRNKAEPLSNACTSGFAWPRKMPSGTMCLVASGRRKPSQTACNIQARTGWFGDFTRYWGLPFILLGPVQSTSRKVSQRWLAPRYPAFSTHEEDQSRVMPPGARPQTPFRPRLVRAAGMRFAGAVSPPVFQKLITVVPGVTISAPIASGRAGVTPSSRTEGSAPFPGR